MAFSFEPCQRWVDGAIGNLDQAEVMNTSCQLVTVRLPLREQLEQDHAQNSLEELRVVLVRTRRNHGTKLLDIARY